MGVCRDAVWVVVVSVALVTIPSLFVRGPPRYRGDGYAAPGWETVIEVFKDNVDKGVEKGGAFAVYYKGELVVDYAGGYADVEAEWHWNQDTLCQIFSSSKGVMAVVMAMLVDRQLLKYEEPIATYWPEFAQNDKENITVEQLLSHQAGLAIIDERFSGLGDPEKIAKLLTKQKPNWPPGEHISYQALTVGLYADEILKRVDPKHRDMKQFFEEEVAQKFGIDLQFGLQDSDACRTARVYGAGFSLFDLPWRLLETSYMANLMIALVLKPDSPSSLALSNPIEFDFHKVIEGIRGHSEARFVWNRPLCITFVSNHPDHRRVTNPSANGFASARGLAKFWSIVANGGEQGGQRLLSEATINKMAEIQVSGFDNIMLFNNTFARGVTPMPALTHDGMAIGTPGAGGQKGYADPMLRLSWAYITNHHRWSTAHEDPRYSKLLHATYQVANRLQNET